MKRVSAPSGEIFLEKGLVAPQRPRARWRHAVDLFSSYWTSTDWKFAWAALLFLVLTQFGTVYLMVWTNHWQQQFFDSIAQRQASIFLSLVTTFILILLVQVGNTLVTTAVEMSLAIRWRTFLTARYVGRWLSHDRYAEIERLRLIDNPDQRIAVDIASITDSGSGLLSIALGLLGTITGAFSFAVILWDAADPINFRLAGHAIHIPGSTLWYASAYALVGGVGMVMIGRPFIRAQMRQQHFEADFRAGLIHVRRQAAQISFVGAAGTEGSLLHAAFDEVRNNYRTVILSLLGLKAGQGLFERVGTVLPLLLSVPRYFAGAITFGQVMAARDAFSQFAMYLGWFVATYPQLATQIANLNRLKALDDAVDLERPRGITAAWGRTPPGVDFVTRNLTLYYPDGRTLLEVGNWTVGRGERWVVQGASGSGKSTLLRAMAGLWPDGEGSVSRSDRLVMLVPQRLYMPVSTLKDAVCFPGFGGNYADDEIAHLLCRVRLDALVGRLNQVRFWQDELSPGEQQRIALARVLLHRPNVIVLDEATSALDPDGALFFYGSLKEDLPGATIVSVVHDERLVPFHTHRLSIGDGRALQHVRAAQ